MCEIPPKLNWYFREKVSILRKSENFVILRKSENFVILRKSENFEKKWEFCDLRTVQMLRLNENMKVPTHFHGTKLSHYFLYGPW